jgi:FtsP/CotA-like multicopper oxidase with cupredoxin domain
MAGSMHTGLAPGRATVDPKVNGFDPSEIVRDFDWGKTRRLPSGRVLREWELIAYDKEIEVVPGVKIAAWTYNGRVPGPTLRCREGELLRLRFANAGSHPHTVHVHGIHRALMDGVPGIGEDAGGGLVEPGERFTYEFDANPFGLHHYHCHASPLAVHISKGLYGVFIVDPKRRRPEADELVLVQNAFDPNFDEDNEVYAVNTVAFHYMYRPIQVKRNELVRIYLLNIVEFDPINSFHIHGNFFHRFPTGTALEPAEYTDTVIQGQAQRDVLEVRFPYTGRYMFHAHKTEFAELGWMGFFEVVE